jgi:predicted PurR-regulated permease PerM
VATSPTRQRESGVRAPQVTVAPRTLVLLVALSLGSVLLLALAYAVRAVLIQLLIAVVLAMALEPFVQMLERRGLRRGLAVGVTFTLAVLGVARSAIC